LAPELAPDSRWRVDLGQYVRSGYRFSFGGIQHIRW